MKKENFENSQTLSIGKYKSNPDSFMLSLEPRIMFDAAAVDTALNATNNDDANHNDDNNDDHNVDDNTIDEVTPVAGQNPENIKKELLETSPIQFEENIGQFDENVEFLSRGENYSLFATNEEIVLTLKNSDTGEFSTLRMDWTGGNNSATINALNELDSQTNYMLGSQENWITGVDNYEKIVYNEIYDGVDMVMYGSSTGKLEYDFIVEANKDYSQINLNFDGADDLYIDDSGNLVIEMPNGKLTQQAPIAFQDIDGVETQVDVSFEIRDNNQVGFIVGDYDGSKELRIDPILHYSTYLGSSDADNWQGGDLVVDDDGYTYVTGTVTGADFPTKGGVTFGTQIGSSDAFVTKYDPNGLIVYSTYMGGSDNDTGSAITVDDMGHVLMAGTTVSDDIPTFAGNPNENRFGNGSFTEGYVVKLNSVGAVYYGTYIGGDNGNTTVHDIAIDDSGNYYVTGATETTPAGGFNITDGSGGSDPAAYNLHSGGNDAYVMRFNSSGDITYGSYIGGAGEDIGYGVGVDSNGNFFVAGQTDSLLFPTKNQTQVDQTGNDLFITKFNANGSVNYSTYLGGSDEETGHSSMVAIDGIGNAYVVGTSASLDYYRLNAYDEVLDGVTDGVITKLDTDGTVIYSTYYGGSGDDGLYTATTDNSNNLYVAGYTDADYPVEGAIQPNSGGGKDGVVAKFDPDGNVLSSGFFGGAGTDQIHAIDVDASDNIYLFGETTSDDLPLESPEQGAINTSPDYFVASINKNSSPELTDSGDLGLSDIYEDIASSNNNGDLIADILADSVDDEDASDVHGIAIMSLSGTANGTWQYSTDAGATWYDVGAVDESSALLLSGNMNTRLRYQPNAGYNGTETITFRAWDQSDGIATTKVDTAVNGRGTAFSQATAVGTILITSVADAPNVTNASTDEDTLSTSGLIITPNPEDGASITHYQITDITNGTLYLTDGETQISEGQFITIAQGAAGLRWLPDSDTNLNGSFKVYSSSDGSSTTGNPATANITINPIPDSPTVPDITVVEDTLSAAQLVITKNAVDGPEVTHFKITDVTNGTLFLADGETVVNTNTFITEEQAAEGLRWLPDLDTVLEGTFNVQASMTPDDTGLAGEIVTSTISITPVPDDPDVSDAVTDEDVMSNSGLVITRNPGDGDEVQYYRISNINNGTLYLADGETQINEGDYISIEDGLNGLKFLSEENSFADGYFDVQAATNNDGTGTVSATMTAFITVNPVADNPNITNASASEDSMSDDGLIITRNEADGEEVTHFKIKEVVNGHLYLNDGQTELEAGDFITVEQGMAGLKFTGMENSYEDGKVTVQGSLSSDDSGVGTEGNTATITIDPVADTPVVKGGDATGVVQTREGGLIILRHPTDGDEVTHFQITGITNGKLYFSDGTTQINDGQFITVAEGKKGLRFTPNPRGNCFFFVQGSLSDETWGLGDPPARVDITAPILPNANELQNQGNASMHVLNEAQKRTNNFERIRNNEKYIKNITFSEPFSNEKVQNDTYHKEKSTAFFMIKEAATPNFVAPHSALDERVLTETIFKARMAGITDAVSTSFLSLLDGTAYKNPDKSSILYKTDSLIDDDNALTEKSAQELPDMDLPLVFEQMQAQENEQSVDSQEPPINPENQPQQPQTIEQSLSQEKRKFDKEVEKILSAIG